eukprot:TRINITY_DN93122_c0_g1_i1.p1 TRINITY_DN93122_c0_g1~~TRINITY_DN93122_c0_g1_i1.p1  ORF type:complete len:247 (-),score=36.09 TRINITY_DN93122_c0_g1_i1:219-959(-)
MMSLLALAIALFLVSSALPRRPTFPEALTWACSRRLRQPVCLGAVGDRDGTGGGLEFVTHKACPFAQKVWIALEESGMPFSLREVQLFNRQKSTYLLRLNPKGQVPVLVAPDGSVITESERILDWIAKQSPALSPENADAALAWRLCLLSKVAPSGKARMLGGGARATQGLRAALGELENQLQHFEGFAAGGSFSIADAAAVPLVQRLESEFGLPEDLPRLRRWWEQVKSRPAVEKTLTTSWWWWW